MHPASHHRPRTAARALLLLALAPAALAQQPAASAPSSTPPHPSAPRNAIFLDPAHGGDDLGAHLPNEALEKDVTLALANRIRLQLNTFTLPVLLARDSDDPNATPLTPDARAGLANHNHATACIVLHATGSGSGVHIITADLPPAPVADPDHPTPVLWLSAQSASLQQSDHLANSLTTALTRASLPVNRFRANIRPLVSLTCPAVLIELAPLSPSQTPDNAAYQARVAQAVATALLFFHNEIAPTTDPAATTAPSRQQGAPTP